MRRVFPDGIMTVRGVDPPRESDTWEGAPMFVAIRYYQTAPDSTDEVVRRVKEGFVPIIRDTQGFVSYFVLAPSEREDELVSVSVFEDRSGAEESNERAEDWVKENLSELLPLPEVAAGEVVVYESK
jgi:heme-degrading monooxygenase HmoA